MVSPEEYQPARHYSDSFNQSFQPKHASVKSILKPRQSYRDSKILLTEKDKIKKQFKQRYSEQGQTFENKLSTSPKTRVTLNLQPAVVDVSNWKDYNVHESLDIKIEELEAEYKGQKRTSTGFKGFFKECCL